MVGRSSAVSPTGATEPFTPSFGPVKKAELEHLNVEKDDQLWGLAMSGGGIRSASFGLGLLQALWAKEENGSTVFDRLHYVSTVSGGGYIGTSLTWFRFVEKVPGVGDFPFGRKAVGGRTEMADGKPKANLVLDFLRQHGKYLTPGWGLNLLSLLGVVLRSMFLSLSVYLAVFTLLFGAVITAGDALVPGGLFAPRGQATPGIGWLSRILLQANYVLWAAGALVIILAAGAIVYSVLTVRRRGWGHAYQASVWAQRGVGWGLTVFLGLVAVGSLPLVEGWLGDLALPAAGGGTGLGALLGYFQFRELQQFGVPQRVISKLRIYVGALAALYGTLLTGYILGERIAGNPLALGILLAATLLLGLAVNVNYAGLHRMYRDRLMEAFLANKENIETGRWGEATDADQTLLADVAPKSRGKRPYQLINTNVVLVDSPHAKYRGRGGDSFILTPIYCGADSTGWMRTSQYAAGRGGKGMSLGSAMAISGAALNPNAGVAGKGLTRNRSISLLLSILNLRLGYWAPNPAKGGRLRSPPNYLHPGILKGLFGSSFSEKSRILELTDGGHFEQLGLYELIRRRVDVIFASDCGADPDFKFADLANAVERVRTDFGVSIKFWKDHGIDKLKPSTEDGVLNRKVAESPFAVADVWYPPSGTDGEKKGRLYYVKSTLLADLPADVIGYALANESFPDQTTADQFFDEAQFEAYRELGYVVGKRTLTEIYGSSDLTPTDAGEQPSR